MMEVKCPYCYDWNTISDYDYNMNDFHDCMNCFHCFLIDSATIQLK
jgi:hypothetical protein